MGLTSTVKERAIELPNDEIEPVGCFLQWLYTGEYFPKIVGEGIEEDAMLPAIDEDGAQLLKHAKVYTLATKLGVEVSPDRRHEAWNSIA